MTQRQLRRLSRRELLELLITQMEENESLRSELSQANAALADRRIQIANAGSLAEAALQLSGVFLAADQAAQQYLENVRHIEEGSGAL